MEVKIKVENKSLWIYLRNIFTKNILIFPAHFYREYFLEIYKFQPASLNPSMTSFVNKPLALNHFNVRKFLPIFQCYFIYFFQFKSKQEIIQNYWLHFLINVYWLTVYKIVVCFDDSFVEGPSVSCRLKCETVPLFASPPVMECWHDFVVLKIAIYDTT